MKRNENILMFASSDNSDLYYATKFSVPDPIIFFRVDGKTHIVVSDLEIGRAKKEAEVDSVLSLSVIEKILKKNGCAQPKLHHFILHCLREKKIKKITVNSNFPVILADRLRRCGIKISVKEDPFFEERVTKNESEINAIRQTIRSTEAVLKLVVQILKSSNIKGDKIFYDSKPITSEFLRRFISVKLLENDCFVANSIVACGEQGCDPHCIGYGFIKPHKSIIFDIYPRSLKNNYCADMTRTFVKGKPSEALLKLFHTVKEAQELAVNMIRSNVNAKNVHNAVVKFFEQRGYKRKHSLKKPEGFIHSTGHGLGLDVHEPPRISKVSYKLKENTVVTVEPGLYYRSIGAVRIEDTVVVRKNYCQNLNSFPKIFVID